MPNFLTTCLVTMHSSFEDWKKKRGQLKKGPGVEKRPPSVTSRVRVETDPEVIAEDGVQSFNQMLRLEAQKKGRPASEVGSCRSYRSVLTVEEQMNSVEKRIEGIEEKVDRVTQQMDKTHELLSKLLLAKEKK